MEDPGDDDVAYPPVPDDDRHRQVRRGEAAEGAFLAIACFAILYWYLCFNPSYSGLRLVLAAARVQAALQSALVLWEGLGAGRSRVEDRVDPAVGLVVRPKVGEPVERGEPLCTVHHGAGGEPPDRVAARVLGAYRIGREAPGPRPLVLERLGEP